MSVHKQKLNLYIRVQYNGRMSTYRVWVSCRNRKHTVAAAAAREDNAQKNQNENNQITVLWQHNMENNFHFVQGEADKKKNKCTDHGESLSINEIL